MDDLDQIWELLLSGDAASIWRAWRDLTDEEAASVLDHLRRMRDEDGWSETQSEAAAVTLQVIRDQAE